MVDRTMAVRACVYGGSSPSAFVTGKSTEPCSLALWIEALLGERGVKTFFRNSHSLHEPPSKRPLLLICVPALCGFDKVNGIPACELLTQGLEQGRGRWED